TPLTFVNELRIGRPIQLPRQHLVLLGLSHLPLPSRCERRPGGNRTRRRCGVDCMPMGFEAHPVTKERWPDLVQLFDRPIVRTCFCQFYRKVGGGTGAGRQNRRAMKALVDRGSVPGLIGYEDGVPVAWVSLGPREDYAKLRRSPVMKPVDDQPVWSIVCFFVDSDARGRGLSQRMLEAAVDYARSRGARLVEAYPVEKDQRGHPDDMFFGAKSHVRPRRIPGSGPAQAHPARGAQVAPAT